MRSVTPQVETVLCAPALASRTSSKLALCNLPLPEPLFTGQRSRLTHDSHKQPSIPLLLTTTLAVDADWLNAGCPTVPLAYRSTSSTLWYQ